MITETSNWREITEKIVNQLRKSELISNKKEILEKIFKKEEEIYKLEKEITDLKEVLKKEKEKEFVSLVKEEIEKLTTKKENLEKELIEFLNKTKKEIQKDDSFDLNSVILEIRAGTGGEEAALFAQDLFRMYSKYAQKKGWKEKILDVRKTELGGYKEIIFELCGKNVFKKMKNEGGVHRVQRIPVTEKGGRIHTSTATVAVLPKPIKTQIEIRPEDLKIEFYRASGPGGQYVNKRETAVRILHLPTGIVVTSQTERNQLQNKENALKILKAKLLEKELKEKEEKIKSERSSQIKRGERAEKIRTYNFPQNRVTDHRIKKSWQKLDKILEGDLDCILNELEKRLP